MLMASSSGISARLFSALLLTLTAGSIPCRANSLLLAGASSAAGHKDLRNSGQGYLGVNIRTVTDPSVSSLHLKESRGCVVIVVDHDGPAGKAGIREHDVILSINGITIETEDQLRRLLGAMQPGHTVQIVLSRDGTQQIVKAIMADREEIEKQAWEQHWVVPAPPDVSTGPAEEIAPTIGRNASAAPRGFGHGFVGSHLLPGTSVRTGLTLDELGSQLAEYFGLKDGKGLLVHSVESDSPAAIAGIHAGDVIVRVNGTAVESRGDWNKALHDSKGHPVSVTVVRERREQILTMVPEGRHHSELRQPADWDHGLTALIGDRRL